MAVSGVPAAVLNQARRGLQLEQSAPIRSAGGGALARRLSSGAIEFADVLRMRRFFAVNAREHKEAIRRYAPEDAPLIRSWQLHGGDAGNRWSEEVYRRAVRDGHEEKDPILDLFRMSREDVYAALNLGAWRWEYGMDVRKAARFVEEYQRANGGEFLFDRAFGIHGRAVRDALVRRIEGENPFKHLARLVTLKEYQEAASLDLNEARQSLGRPALNWPPFIAYFVLASHASSISRRIDESTDSNVDPLPTWGDEDVNVLRYSEPLADYVTYFHPRGRHYQSNAKADLVQALHRVMRLAAKGELREEVAREALFEARRWTARNRLAGGLGHVLLEAWRRRDWAVFTAALPPGHPVYGPFANFIAKTGTWLEKGVVDAGRARS